MTRRRYILNSAGLALAAMVSIGAGSPQVPAPGHSSSFPLLSAMKKEIQELHSRCSASLVRVDVQQSSAGVLSPALREEFDRWLSTEGGFGRGGRGGDMQGRDNQGGRDRIDPRGDPRSMGGGGGRGGGRIDGMGGPPFGPRGGGPGGLNWNDVRRFLGDRAEKAEKSGKPDDAAMYRALAVNVSLYRNGFQGELSAVMLTRDGYAIVPAGLLRVAHEGNNTISATLPDGTKTGVKFVGTNLISGYTIVQFDKFAGIKPAPVSNDIISQGDMLMFITAGQGQSGILIAPGKPGAVAVERLAVPTEERSGTFLFDTATGDLAAFVSSGSWNGGRQAFSSERLKREVNYIIKNRKDIEQRALGVGYKPLPADVTAKIEGILAGRRAVQVTEILPKTLAAGSELKVNDVLMGIDGRPIGDFVAPDGRMPLPELIHLQADLATRTGRLPLAVIRDGKEITVNVPLD